MARRGTVHGHPPGVACLARWPSSARGCGGGDEPARISGRRRHGLHERPAPRRVRVGRRRGAGRRAARARRAARPRGRAAHPAARAARDRRARPSRGTRRSWRANAQRAADDPTAMAYLGELDYGATAVSLPITNKAGLLQVSPSDGLTSLTRRPPGRPARRTRALLPDGPAQLRPRRARATSTRRERLVDRLGELGGAPASASCSTARSTAASWRAGHHARARRGHHAGRRRGVPRARGRHPRHRPQAGRGGARRGRLPVRGRTRDHPDARLRSAPALPGVPVLASSGILALPGARAPPPEPEQLEAVGPALDAGACRLRGHAPRARRHRARGPRPPPRDRGRARARQSSCNCLAWSSTGPARTGISARAQTRFSSR